MDRRINARQGVSHQFPARPGPLGAICFSLTLLLAAHQRAGAATITVDSTADDLSLGPNGTCTLREAIIAANTDAPVDGCAAGGGADTVVLPAGTYFLSIPVRSGTQDTPGTGDLDVAGYLTIEGAGADSTIIDAQQLSRVLDLGPGADGVIISNVTIRNGKADDSSDPTWGSYGGGILQRNGSLVLDHVVLASNTAGTGSGLAVAGGTVDVEASTLRENQGTSRGGALWTDDGSVTIDGSTFTGNQQYAYFCSGPATNPLCAYSGAAALVVAKGLVTVTSSSFHANHGSGAGAIEIGESTNPSGPLVAATTISNSELTENAADGIGGAVFNGGSLTMTDCTLTGNEAFLLGDSTWSVAGSALLTNGSADLERVTIAANGLTPGETSSVTVVAYGGLLSVTDSMVIDNGSGGVLVGPYFPISLSLKHSTIARNAAPGCTAISAYYGNAAAITIEDSTISDNTILDGDAPYEAGHAFGSTGPTHSI